MGMANLLNFASFLDKGENMNKIKNLFLNRITKLNAVLKLLLQFSSYSKNDILGTSKAPGKCVTSFLG